MGTRFLYGSGLGSGLGFFNKTRTRFGFFFFFLNPYPTLFLIRQGKTRPIRVGSGRAGYPRVGQKLPSLAISIGKKAIIEEYVLLELWLAPLVAKLNDPT